MGRAQIGPAEKVKRQQARAGSTLKGQMVTSGLQARYKQAVQILLHFLVEAQIPVSAWDDLDAAVGAWLEHAYSEGEHKSLARDALAASKVAILLATINGVAEALMAAAMLRSGELYSLKVGDVRFMKEQAVLNLEQSRSGHRTGHAEMVVVESAVPCKWLRRACDQKPRANALLSKGPVFFNSFMQ